jgi:hypothetical protein
MHYISISVYGDHNSVQQWSLSYLLNRRARQGRAQSPLHFLVWPVSIWQRKQLNVPFPQDPHALVNFQRISLGLKKRRVCIFHLLRQGGIIDWYFLCALSLLCFTFTHYYFSYLYSTYFCLFYLASVLFLSSSSLFINLFLILLSILINFLNPVLS